MFVAARRVTAAEAAARPCGCGSTGGEPAQQCTRMLDHVLVQAFEEDRLPKDICRIPPAAEDNVDATGRAPAPGQQRTGAAAVCACLKQCGECACCGEPWVLLGSVVVDENGLGTDRPERPALCQADRLHLRCRRTRSGPAGDARRVEHGRSITAAGRRNRCRVTRYRQAIRQKR